MATSSVTVLFPCPVVRVWQMENGNISGSWEGILEAVEGGTRLTCTETVHAKHWWMHHLIPGYLKRRQKLYLDDLRKELLK